MIKHQSDDRPEFDPDFRRDLNSFASKEAPPFGRPIETATEAKEREPLPDLPSSDDKDFWADSEVNLIPVRKAKPNYQLSSDKRAIHSDYPNTDSSVSVVVE